MYSNQRSGRIPTNFGFGGGGTPPRDVLILLGVLFVTYSAQILGASFLGYLFLSPNVVWKAYLWQLVTYAFLGHPGTDGLWFLLALLILFWFSRDVYRVLGQRSFWSLLLTSVLTASIVATVTHLLITVVGLGGHFPMPFVIMQGHVMLTTIMIAAFAVLYGNATIYFFFVLPLRARWFLWIEILFAFMAFLPTRDLPGFLGISAAVGMTYSTLTTGSLRRTMREWRLRLERRYLELKMKYMRSRRNIRIVKDDRDKSNGGDVHRGPWIN